MDVDTILEKYSLTRETTTRYVDAITRMNQSQAADEIGVSRDTVHRHKRVFAEMTPVERALVISSLTQENLLEETTTER